MANSSTPSSRQVIPSVRKAAQRIPLATITGRQFPPVPPLPQQFAPAWFYSALNWLGSSYYDASNARQSFSPYMAGSDVDPYAHLGSTRLFLIVRSGDTFRLTLAADSASPAPMSGGTEYPDTDAGIEQMYVALSASPIFRFVKYCYIPGQVGLNLYATAGGSYDALKGGYDPASGLRTLVLGSAVSQVVPLDDFSQTHNEQIYNDSPAIVPLATSLVYDVTQYNTPGANTFVLPVCYVRDEVSPGNYYVSRLGTTGSAMGATVTCGQTAIFPGGPGYTDAAATALTLKGSTIVAAPDHNFTTYTFDTAKAVTVSTLGSKVVAGGMSLTYTGASRSSAFSQQRIIGFYRDSSWTTCLGVPIYDFGSANANFTAATLPLLSPSLIYDPTHPSLNGGSLQNVVQKIRQSAYLYPTDRLISILDAAIAFPDTDSGVGLSVSAAGLEFNMNSNSASSIVDELTVPVVATVTTTPPPPAPSNPAPPKPAGPAVDAVVRSRLELNFIGSGANAPSQSQPAPVTIQVGLNAAVPREALAGTGITSLEIGTSFPEQPLGSASVFQSAAGGVVLNLLDRHTTSPAFAPYDLATATAGITFTAGVYYVLSLTGTNLSARGADGSTASSVLPTGAAAGLTFVGAVVYTAATTTVRLYPKLQLALAAPAVGTHGVQQGNQYSVRLTFGDKNSQYDLLDASQTVIDSNISVLNPVSTDGSTPQPGDLYFGSFIGGSNQMIVWSVPVFLTVAPPQLPGAGTVGSMTLDAQVSGVPDYALQITDSSLFVYTNINIDTGSIGSVSSANVYVASAVINSSPDDTTSKAFAPCKLLMGLVRAVQMGAVLKFVFVPSDDSVVIGQTRYMLSVINLDALGFDPSSRPYPPVFWPQSRYWQFANRHNPYLDVQYTGATQADRISQAQSDVARIALQTAGAGEPMHMYLDTNPGEMTVWPIYEFPYDTATQSVDQGKLKSITDNVLQLLKTTFPATTRPGTPGPLDAEQISVPGELRQGNPYTAGGAADISLLPAVNDSLSAQSIEPSIAGQVVTNLSPGFVANVSVEGLQAQQSLRVQQSRQAAADLAFTKSLAPEMALLPGGTAGTGINSKRTSHRRRLEPIYGFSVYNPGTGEAYIVELVPADQAIPDQLPDPTQNLTYDPYYVRVVFLSTLTCYNMSIIVPAMVHDQYGHFARLGTAYANVLSKTDEPDLGYMYSLYDPANNFDNLTFSLFDQVESIAAFTSETAIYTNLPYSTQQTATFNPISLFGGMSFGAVAVAAPVEARALRRNSSTVSLFDTSQIDFSVSVTPSAYFVCRRQNWSADCHLMQATHTEGTSIYLAFGGGDLVPFSLDAEFDVDKRQPAHMYKLTHTFADQEYDAAQTISVGNKPYVVAVTTSQGGLPEYTNFSINSTAGTADLQIGSNETLSFPPECYVVGQASTTLVSVDTLGVADTGGFVNRDENGNPVAQQFQLITYNNLVYLIRAVANVPELRGIGGLGVGSGLLVDTFVPATTGNLALARGARHKRSGLSYFGSTYTPTTMVDTLDTLDFTSITGEWFYAPTIFIPIPELDATKGFVANLSNFLGQQIWTLIYPEVVAQPGATANGVSYPNGLNVDVEGKPILSLQKLHFVYDPLVVMFTPNDLAHKYPLQPKQQVLALTNGQIQEAICWRSANVQPQRRAPRNVCAQQILPPGFGMDRPNIIYSSHNRPVMTPVNASYQGMSVRGFRSISGVVYNIEESALAGDQTGSGLVSTVSSVSNMLVGVLFDYDNNDLGTLKPYDPAKSTKGVVFINGYLGAAGYAFSSPDHFDVNDVLPSQVPLLEQIASVFGFDVAFFNTDVSLPRQFWSMVYDTFTAAGLPNYISNVPTPTADPAFGNRTRSLILSLRNSVRPTELGLMDTYSSVVSANLHLQNGVTGSVFLSKKADRDVASIGTNPTSNSAPLFGLPTKYDFFIFSRDHYWTLKGATFELIDQGYAMCLVDDGSGTGTKVAKYYIDADGNYNELYAYALYSPNGGIIESSTFTLKVTLGSPANPAATPAIPETPNNVNPQDLVAQINKISNLIYAVLGASTPGQPPAFIPIQAVGGSIQAAPLLGPPGFNGYNLNVVGANRQPVQISQIFSGPIAYSIAGSTTIQPFNPKTAKAVPFYGSLSHGLDRMVPVTKLQSKDLLSFIPRPPVPPGPASGLFGGNGLGSLIGTPFSAAFQGSPAITGVMKGDDAIFYTFNAVTGTVMDSTGKPATVSGGQYFVDATDSLNLIYGVVALPKFTFNGNTYTVNLSTTLPDGVTSRYSLTAGGKSYFFDPGNASVRVDETIFTFNPLKGGAYTVTYAAANAPSGSEAPSPIPLTPFSITAGGVVATIDVFNNPGGLNNILLGVTGRQYSYDPVHGTVVVTQGPTSSTRPLWTGLAVASSSGYGYVIDFKNGSYTVNGTLMFPYSAATSGSPASYSLMTSPQMFTIGGNFYAFDRDVNGSYVSVTGDGQTYPVNPYQFSINGVVYIINTNVQPNTVVGGGNVYTMTAGNTQFLLNGVQYTVALKQNSLNGATVSGQFNITQGNVVVLENYVYRLDTLNGQIVGNGTTYPLTTSGFTYTISTADRSFTVTTEPNAATVTIGNVVYQINNTTVVGDGVIYPILEYRTFVDGATTFTIGLDGTVSTPPPFMLSGTAPYTRATFTDGATYTVNDIAAFDGTAYHLMSGSPAQFTAGALTYTVRTDGVAITAGSAKTYLVNTSGPLSPTQFTFGTKTIFFGRAGDVAAFDGRHYYAINNGQFTDSNTGRTYTISGNTAVNEGNSYEIFSNLGQGAYFQVPGGPVYFVNVAVADFGTASGDVFNVFPVSGGQFSIPLSYTVSVSGSTVTVNASTFAGGPTVVSTLKASGGSLTGGFFVDPVTKITYTCVVDGGAVSFVDSNNAVYPYPAAGTTDTFVANVVVATGVTLAVDSSATPAIYPVANNQFVAGAVTYTINVPVAYANAAGPFWAMVNGRFIVPKADPVSSIAYTVKGGSVTKGYVLSADDEFSIDGNVVYTVNEVNVVKATNQATLSGASPLQTLVDGGNTYTLDETNAIASIQPTGLKFNNAAKQFTVTFNGLPVTYTVSGATVTDDRVPGNVFPATIAGTQFTFTDTMTGVTFTFKQNGNNPITVEFAYTNHFFADVVTGVTYYIDEADKKVEAISYLPETTRYAFVPADGQTYLIHYNSVSVVFPVIAGAHVNAGVATVGSDRFAVNVDQVQPAGGGAAIPINRNSFEINGNLYTITGTPAGSDYSSCSVVGDAMTPRKFLSANTFKLTDPAVTYTLQLDAANLPTAVLATFGVRTSQDLLTINDNVYIVTYNTVTTGSLLGQGQPAIPIVNSAFTLTNPFDATKAKFIFADLNIYDAASVVGQFTVYLAPTFFLGGATYTLDTVNLSVTDNNKRPFPLLPNPMMFSINGANYVIDTNRVPHAVIGNNNVSPLATDVTVEGGNPIPNSTFTLNGQIYKYTEDASHNLLAITATGSYPVAQPGLTFKLDSSLIFTISTTPPAAGNYPGTVVPIGTVTAGTLTLNLYKGTPESGNADFFTYKNVLYTLVKSGGVYVAIQKSYTVYASKPVTNQQQLAVFDLNGVTYMVTDGTTPGAASPLGVNPGTMWAQTATSSTETQFGLVYGFTAQPINVSQSAVAPFPFQFQVTDANGNNTLYDIVYAAGGNANVVKIDVPALLPTFTQSGPFTFTASYPLTFETGGYNAFTTFVSETATPSESFAAAYTTPVTSTDPLVDSLITAQGDFSVEFWHSIPVTPITANHPFTYAASTNSPLVYYVDVDFEDESDIFIAINNVVLSASATPPVFSSGWRHFALVYTQPYTMLCQGAGFEVKQATGYNFNRDFSIAMTFSLSDVTTEQGLLYKGTGSDNTSPELSMSYRVSVSGNHVVLSLTDGTSTIATFTGPEVQPDTFYQLIIVKHTNTMSGSSDSNDPYAPPLDISELTPAMSSGASATTNPPPTSGSGTISFSDIKGNGSSTPKLNALLTKIGDGVPKSYSVTISVRTIQDDGGFGAWARTTTSHDVGTDAGLAVNSTGSAHLLIGEAYDDQGQARPLGRPVFAPGHIRNVYLFNGAINQDGIKTIEGTVDIADASSDDLVKAGLVGYWTAQYDPTGVVTSPYDSNAVAIATNASMASLAPLMGREFEGATLYLNGYAMPLEVISWSAAPPSLVPYSAGSSLLNFNAGKFKLEEISMWRMARQAYQVIDDMFGRLIPTNEPFLILYLSGSFEVQAINAPILPMNKYIDNIAVTNAVASMNLAFSPASLDLAGCPAVGRCGPLVSPNLYTPPGVALTVCDTVPSLTTYSVTLNSVTSALAGEINEAYVYIKNNVLTLYAGKKVGDLVLSWVSQEQGDVQLLGYIEGAPPCPMANLTNKPATTFLEPTTVYAGATSITLTTPTSVSLKYQKAHDHSGETKWDAGDNFGILFGIGTEFAPFGFGVKLDKAIIALDLKAGYAHSWINSSSDESTLTAANKIDESKKYTVKLEGTLAPVTGDPFMASLNTLTTPSATPGNPSSKTAILPNPNLGGFTASNPPSPLPKAPTEEKFGARMYIPSPYGQAFVTSETLDVYQQTLLQSNTVYGFVKVPNKQIPRDLNIVSFRMSSKYIRPGCLDGVVGYVYNPATLPNGTQTYATSTGQMQVAYDKNFSQGEVGHNASYMRVVEAYKLKKQIDQQTFNALAIYQTAYKAQGLPDDSSLLPALDFYNEYVWSSRGGAQEVKHTYATSYEEVYTTKTSSSDVNKITFNAKLYSFFITFVDAKGQWKDTSKDTTKYSYTTTASTSFDVTASFDGIETDTQMRYASNNDAHFVMNYNSMFNPNNQSGLNLVIGSDGLVYNIVPSVSSGAGLPVSDNVDDSRDYTQPQPAYTSGNANGLTGALEPYDRPGKTKLFRTYAFYLQPSDQNADDFWNTVIDPVWLANSPDSDADAMRSAIGKPSVPWRLTYRVTYSERFLPPVSTEAIVVPQITPVMAVPVLNPASDFLFQQLGTLPRPAHNPANDIEANIVLAVPTASGLSAGSVPVAGPNAGKPVLANNVIPFDLMKSAAAAVNWGDTANMKLLTQLMTSALGLNTVPMSSSALPGSTKVVDVIDPVTGGPLYSVYTDPNGLTVNVPTNFGVTVYQDVNGNPIQYFDGKLFHSLQADYVATTDGTVMYYIQPPAAYDQSAFDLLGDYDLFGHPGDQWRYYLVSGLSANMTSEPTVTGAGPFLSSSGSTPYTGFTIASSQHDQNSVKQVQGYVLMQGILQWPHLNSNAETFADVLVYKAMSLLDTFPIGDPEVLISFLKAQYAGAPFAGNDEIALVFARNIVSYFNVAQQAMLPQ